MTVEETIEKYKWVEKEEGDSCDECLYRGASIRAKARIEELKRAIWEVLALLGMGECNINACIYVLNTVLSHKQPPPQSEGMREKILWVLQYEGVTGPTIRNNIANTILALFEGWKEGR